jgi:hypothetical protein
MKLTVKHNGTEVVFEGSDIDNIPLAIENTIKVIEKFNPSTYEQLSDGSKIKVR